MIRKLIDALADGEMQEKADFIFLLENIDEDERSYLHEKARRLTEKIYGKKIFIRGLIEFSNYCRNNCFYCGIRQANKEAERYRLSKEDILSCCRQGFQLGFRTFVLQSGEDDYYSAKDIADIVRTIKEEYPEVAVTLSIGERSKEDYRLFREAGTDRYLLRHESADKKHFERLKPASLSFDKRMSCLKNLKELGYQTGCGFMVGSPYQTKEALAQDLLFIKDFQPEMIGIGPFIPHHNTPFKDFPQGSTEETLILISLLRLLQPHALIPATTALGTADPDGRKKGILAGANVIMPNLSPLSIRKQYQLYDNKICSGNETAEGLESLRKELRTIDREITIDRGDMK
ncbi:MAG: [FeFe] hydrogenase H-cluster radical SAM maturase HydE [Treponemataceae bacterium]|nr:[FeFe] hydrogenase H-cluster radical SAM maturase HydE [Treponemataceae bacterium]